MRQCFSSLLLSLIAYSSVAYTLDLTPADTQFEYMSVVAMRELAARYEHGEGVPRDMNQAIKIYCHAARKGDADANYQLGWIYANGRGVPRDDAIAAAWFSRAAEAGDRFAQKMLQRLTTVAVEDNRRCLLANGKEILPPIKSVPNPDKKLIHYWVQRLAPDYELDANLVLAVIETESNFNVKARSEKNAQGLMQLIPATADRFNVDDVWDPLQNLHGGMAYLRWLLDHFKGDISLALAGYNAGENAVAQYKGVPPFQETRAYVKRILKLLQAAHDA